LRREHHTIDFGKVARIGIVVTVLAAIGSMYMGDNQARLMDKEQPMKMAAAEALYDTANGASFSLLTIGDLDDKPIFQIRIPHLLSIIATNSWSGQVQGIHNLQAKAAAKYGSGSYVPVVWLCYWSFRIMVGMGILMLLLGGVGLWLVRKRRLEKSHRYLKFATIMVFAPFIANSFGWIFTEVGRQPWVVYGLLSTSKAVSTFSPGYVAASLIGFTAIYSFLAVIEIGLMVRYIKKGPADEAAAVASNHIPELVY
jgi:cytochrome d ubiquinol oxidase subunit I